MNSMVTQDESNLVPAESLITLSVFENDLKRDQFEQLENDSNIKAFHNKWKCLNLISSDHLKFVQYFFSNFSSFSNRSNWEEKRFIFTRLSLQILAALRELINSQNIKQIENEIILNMIQARREIAKITIQLIFEIGPFKEVSNPLNLILSIREYYSPCDDIRRLEELISLKSRPNVKLVENEEIILTDILNESVKVWPKSFVQIANLSTNVQNLGNDLNFESSVNSIVEFINEMKSKYSGKNDSKIQMLIQYRLNALIRANRFSVAYFLLFGIYFADFSKCFGGKELEARRDGKCANLILKQFSPPKMICQLLSESKTFPILFDLLFSFNIKPASFIQRLNLFKCYSLFPNAQYEFSNSILSSSNLSKMTNQNEKSIQFVIQSSIRSIIFHHISQTTFQPRSFLNPEFIQTLQTSFKHIKVLMSLITELWYYCGIGKLENGLNLEISVRFQTIVRILSMSLNQIKMKKDLILIIKMIQKLFSDFGQIQISTRIFLLSNLKPKSIQPLYKHLFDLIKVIDGWMFDGFHCKNRQRNKKSILNHSRIRPHLDRASISYHYSADSHLPILVSSIEELDSFPKQFRKMSHDTDYISLFRSIFDFCESRLGENSSIFFEKLNKDLKVSKYTDLTNRSDQFEIQSNLSRDLQILISPKLKNVKTEKVEKREFEFSSKTEAENIEEIKRELCSENYQNIRFETISEINFNFPNRQIKTENVDLQSVV